MSDRAERLRRETWRWLRLAHKAQHQIEEDRKRADDTSGAVGLGDAGPATGAGAPAGDATDERPVPPEHRLPVLRFDTHEFESE